jgi:hypothetical protein
MTKSLVTKSRNELKVQKNSMKKTILTIFFLFIFIFLYSCICILPILAQNEEGIIFNNPVGSNNPSVPGLIGKIIKGFLGVTGVIALILIIYGGAMWMGSAGHSERISTAYKTIVWSAIGLLIIFGSYALLKFVFGVIT